MRMRETFGIILEKLWECWPAVGWRVLDSRYFGVAQRRRRVYIVCGPSEDGVASVLELEREVRSSGARGSGHKSPITRSRAPTAKGKSAERMYP